MHDVKVVRPSDSENWNDQLASGAGFSFFHSREWADVLTKSYAYQPFYLTSENSGQIDNLLAIMEVKSAVTGNRGVSLPFTDICEPVAQSEEQFRKLWSAAIDTGKQRKWRYLEIRGGEQYLSGQKSFVRHIGHRLDLAGGHEAVYTGLRDSTKRNIKKAKRERVEVNISNSADALKEFCRLNVLTRRKHGLPPQPSRFFRCLFEGVIAKEKGFVALATLGNEVIAANVYLCFGDQVIYKYGASDDRRQHLRANNLIMWKAIKWSCDRGYKRLCFGRTETHHQGLIQFKAGWGAEIQNIPYYRYDLHKEDFVDGSSEISPAYQTTFRKLPTPVLKLIGRIAYRHMG